MRIEKRQTLSIGTEDRGWVDRGGYDCILFDTMYISRLNSCIVIVMPTSALSPLFIGILLSFQTKKLQCHTTVQQTLLGFVVPSAFWFSTTEFRISAISSAVARPLGSYTQHRRIAVQNNSLRGVFAVRYSGRWGVFFLTVTAIVISCPFRISWNGSCPVRISRIVIPNAYTSVL